MAALGTSMGASDPDYFLPKIDGPVTSLSYLRRPESPSAENFHDYLLSGTEKGSLYTWDLRTRRPAALTPGAHQGSVMSLTVVAEDELISQGRDGFIHRWRADAGSTWTKLDTIQCVEFTFCPIACFRLNNYLLLAMPSEEKSQIEIKEMHTKSTIMTLVPSREARSLGMVMDIKIISRNDQSHVDVMACYEDGSMILWDLRTPEEQRSKVNFHQETVTSFDLCTKTKRGLSGSVDNTIVLWKFDDAGNVKKSLAAEMPNAGVACVRTRPDGKLFAVGGWDSSVRLYGGLKLTPLVTLWGHEQTVQSISFSADNSFATGSKDGNITVWSIYKDK